MKIRKKISLYTMFTKTTVIILTFAAAFSSCRKETTTSKLSSKSYFVLPYNMSFNNFFVSVGEPGFFARSTKSTKIYGEEYETFSKFERIGLNTANGIFSQLLLPFNPPLPEFTTFNNSVNQLKQNGNDFILTSNYSFFDTGLSIFSYLKLYLTDKNLSKLTKFELPDSTVSDVSVNKMSDGRYVVWTLKKGNIKRINCFNSNLQLDWSKTADYGPNTFDYYNFQLLATSNSIYLLQLANYITNNYRILQYDYDGNKISIYDVRSTTNKYAAGQLIESSNGYYIIGTKYIPGKSDNDIHISSMSPANKLMAEHELNITDYLPDWNTATSGVFRTYFSGNTSYVIKTANGFAYTFAYPDNKNKSSLALVLLNNEMKIKSVKVLAKNIGSGFDGIDNEYITLLNDDNRLYIIWRQNWNFYFYVLDNDGNLVK
jgi:hypothetical protein